MPIVTPVVMPAMFAAAVVAVNPAAPGMVPWNPDILPVPVPIAGAVGVISAVTEVDTQTNRLRRSRQGHASRQKGDEKKSIFDHHASFSYRLG